MTEDEPTSFTQTQKEFLLKKLHAGSAANAGLKPLWDELSAACESSKPGELPCGVFPSYDGALAYFDKIKSAENGLEREDPFQGQELQRMTWKLSGNTALMTSMEGHIKKALNKDPYHRDALEQNRNPADDMMDESIKQGPAPFAHVLDIINQEIVKSPKHPLPYMEEIKSDLAGLSQKYAMGCAPDAQYKDRLLKSAEEDAAVAKVRLQHWQKDPVLSRADRTSIEHIATALDSALEAEREACNITSGSAPAGSPQEPRER